MSEAIIGRLAPLLPRRISGQIMLLLVFAVVIMHALVTLAITVEMRGGRGPGDPGPALARLLAAPRDDAAQAVIFDAVRQALPELRWRETGGASGGPPGWPGGPGGSVAVRDGRGGTWIIEPGPPPLVGPMVVTVVFLVVSIGLAVWWAARAITAPLSAFAAAAADYDPKTVPAPLPETGPDEVKAAAHAFNAMRARISRLVDDRTRMLAALGHDLRTPITRMKLRAEFIEDPPLREQMVRDLDQMHRMVDSAVSFLRDERTDAAPVSMDVAACVQTVCDGFADLGKAVTYAGPDRLIAMALPDQIERAVSNLVDNALKYGGAAEVTLTSDGEVVDLRVADPGPGIPEEGKAALQEAFVRGNAARTMDETTGFGLGLSIARAVIEAHGGSLRLFDRRPSGLVARLEWPVGGKPGGPSRDG